MGLDIVRIVCLHLNKSSIRGACTYLADDRAIVLHFRPNFFWICVFFSSSVNEVVILWHIPKHWTPWQRAVTTVFLYHWHNCLAVADVFLVQQTEQQQYWQVQLCLSAGITFPLQLLYRLPSTVLPRRSLPLWDSHRPHTDSHSSTTFIMGRTRRGRRRRREDDDWNHHWEYEEAPNHFGGQWVMVKGWCLKRKTIRTSLISFSFR